MEGKAVSKKTLGNLLIAIENLILDVCSNVILILLALLVIVIGANVMTRYIFNYTIPWAYELGIYIFIYIVYIGTALGVAQDTHVKIDFLVNKLKNIPRIIVISLNYLILILMSLFMLFYGTKESIAKWENTGPIIKWIPLGVIYFAVALCGYLSFIFCVTSIFKFFDSKEKHKI